MRVFFRVNSDDSADLEEGLPLLKRGTSKPLSCTAEAYILRFKRHAKECIGHAYQ